MLTGRWERQSGWNGLRYCGGFDGGLAKEWLNVRPKSALRSVTLIKRIQLIEDGWRVCGLNLGLTVEALSSGREGEI